MPPFTTGHVSVVACLIGQITGYGKPQRSSCSPPPPSSGDLPRIENGGQLARAGAACGWCWQPPSVLPSHLEQLCHRLACQDLILAVTWFMCSFTCPMTLEFLNLYIIDLEENHPPAPRLGRLGLASHLLIHSSPLQANNKAIGPWPHPAHLRAPALRHWKRSTVHLASKHSSNPVLYQHAHANHAPSPSRAAFTQALLTRLSTTLPSGHDVACKWTPLFEVVGGTDGSQHVVFYGRQNSKNVVLPGHLHFTPCRAPNQFWLKAIREGGEDAWPPEIFQEPGPALDLPTTSTLRTSGRTPASLLWLPGEQPQAEVDDDTGGENASSVQAAVLHGARSHSVVGQVSMRGGGGRRADRGPVSDPVELDLQRLTAAANCGSNNPAAMPTIPMAPLLPMGKKKSSANGQVEPKSKEVQLRACHLDFVRQLLGARSLSGESTPPPSSLRLLLLTSLSSQPFDPLTALFPEVHARDDSKSFRRLLGPTLCRGSTSPERNLRAAEGSQGGGSWWTDDAVHRENSLWVGYYGVPQAPQYGRAWDGGDLCDGPHGHVSSVQPQLLLLHFARSPSDSAVVARHLRGDHSIEYGNIVFEARLATKVSDPIPPASIRTLGRDGLPPDLVASYSGEGTTPGYGPQYPRYIAGSLLQERSGTLVFLWHGTDIVLRLRRLDFHRALALGKPTLKNCAIKSLFVSHSNPSNS
eukprot:SM000046S16434  [mRNA]  locus=s46:759513:763124:+ [translate_table: standard]